MIHESIFFGHGVSTSHESKSLCYPLPPPLGSYFIVAFLIEEGEEEEPKMTGIHTEKEVTDTGEHIYCDVFAGR